MMEIYMVFDKKLDGFVPDSLMCATNSLVALRRFSDCLKHIPGIFDHKEDFEIYRICTVNSNSGEVVDSSKSFISTVSALYPADSE